MLPVNPVPPKRRKRWPYFVLLVVVLAVVAIGSDKIRRTPLVQQKILHHSTPKKAVDTTALNAALAPILTANPSVKVSVATVDLDNNQAAAFGTGGAFVAASTAKLITAACFLHDIEQGTHSLNEQLDGYSAEFQLQQMVNQSDNDSWNLLNTDLGLSHLLAYAHSNGTPSYNLDDNSLTATDEAQLLARLYKDQLLSHDHTQLLLSYMQNTNEEDMIPAALPVGVTAYHKYGLLDGNLHDVGILAYQGHALALAIYTSGADLTDNKARIATIQSITRTVVQYYFGLTG
jgi:beta-lactamase class A